MKPKPQSQLDRIEAAIQAQAQRFSERMDEFDTRLSALEHKGAKTAGALLQVTKIVEQLTTERGTVLARKHGTLVLDKERVYRAARSAGYSRLDFLKELEQAGILDVQYGNPNRYTRKVRINGRSIRSVVIINFEKESNI